ncbi:MAG: chromosome segregation protein SMC [Planctomycetes bacterium]|nr:chromosome segregation protein SMC [Planctomycetota bacterium]
MKLKRLVARGFKSFADRTEFEFDQRLTGIIGPNGCGKSNVVDAIKWVLGDQRAKSLRGTEMTDVIFKGAEGRDAMGMAEVVITFEDPQGRLDGRTEIDIARRLTLDKESSYLLNGQEVRLKDVRDALLDTGLGTGGYSVMEQGRIDAVLSANPEARRAIFEEAAGISRFKLQKKEALRKLERTDQNLARVTDLLEERARRIRSLRIQAGKARRFHELQTRLRDLRSALAVLDGQVLRAAIAEQQARMQELALQLHGIDEARDAAAEVLAAGDATIRDCEAALASVQDELRRCQGDLTMRRERGAAQQQRAQEQRAEVQRTRARQDDLAGQRDERAIVLATARDALAGKEAELIELHRDLEQQRQVVQQAQSAVRALQAERERLRGRQLELLHDRTRARNIASDQTAKIAAARAREQKLAERQAVLLQEVARLDGEVARHAGDLVDWQTRERLLGEREQRALLDLQDADGAAAALAREESEIRRTLSQVDGRRQALVAMEAHMEGLDAAPRHVLQSRPAGLRGRLLDLIEIDLAWSAALEAALGPYVQALVVDTRANAEAIVRQLQEARLGRVLLLVEEEFGVELEHGSLLPLPEGAQFLLDLVRHTVAGAEARTDSRRLLAWLLRGVVVVPALADAEADRVDLCFVTADGTLLCGPRVEGGAAAEGHAGLVVRRSQIQRLGDEVAVIESGLQAMQVGRDAAVGRVDRLKAELKAIAEALSVTRRRLHETQGQLGRLAARGHDVRREREELELEGAELSAARCGALALLGCALFDQFLVGRRQERVQQEENEFTARIGDTETRAQQEQRHEQELRLNQVQAGEAREGLVRSIRMHDDALREFDRTLQELAERMAVAEDAAVKAESDRLRFMEEAAVIEDQVAELEQQKQERQATVDAARQERSTRQRVVQEWEQKRSATTEAATQTRLQLAEAEHQFTRLEDKLREESEVELRRCLGEIIGIGIEGDTEFLGPLAPDGVIEALFLPPIPPAQVVAWYGLQRLWTSAAFDPIESKKEVQVLQSQKDRLGAVNLDAVKELDDEEGQFGTLEKEVEDLKEARRSLLETLRKLEAESRNLFEQTFTEARKNFQEIFRKLFQGGKADMYLGNLEDPLETGIEIVAQPPGKQLQSINLLSGGERSLTAVAILFALFKVRPSPFCILDEVDAALDETNVERFLRVLRDFTANTQFCIVTHHKRTMADCQVLYGITMQRRGVSSRIAVSLQEVDSFQQGTAPAAGSKDPALKQRIAGEEQVGFA